MGLLSQSGAAPAGSGFSIAFPREIRFAGWLHLPLGPFATRTSTFKLYVDGRLITSQDAVYQVQRR
jgi:hypothetical protein